MAHIRLLTSVQGDGPVVGNFGDLLEVDERVARVWADGERAERVDMVAVASPKRARADV